MCTVIMHQYKLTYPHVGSVYREKTLKKGAKRCYKEFCRLNDVKEGLFVVTDIDKKKSFNFRVEGKKMFTVKDQTRHKPPLPLASDTQ